MIDDKIIPKDVYEPTGAERTMAGSIDFLVSRMLSGELKGIALCAINNDDEESAFYLSTGPDSDNILRGPMERLRVMYETNRMFRRLDTSPKTNRSFRMH